MTSLEQELVEILGKYCGERGETEGAVETLKRLIRERDSKTMTLEQVKELMIAIAESLKEMDKDLVELEKLTSLLC